MVICKHKNCQSHRLEITNPTVALKTKGMSNKVEQSEIVIMSWLTNRQSKLDARFVHNGSTTNNAKKEMPSERGRMVTSRFNSKPARQQLWN